MNPSPTREWHRLIVCVAIATAVLFGVALVPTAFALNADTVEIIGGRFPAGQAGLWIDVRLVNSERLSRISVPVEFREIETGAFVNEVTSMTFLERLLDPDTLPDVTATNQYASRDGLDCQYGPPTFTDGLQHPDVTSPEGFLFVRGGEATGNFLGPGADPVGFGSMQIGFSLTSVPGRFEIDTVCVDPSGDPSSHLRFESPDVGVYTPVFKKGVVRLNGPPIARDTTYTVTVNGIIEDTLPVFDPNAEDTLVHTILVPPPPGSGSLDLDPSGHFQFNAPSADGIISFEYIVSDGLVPAQGVVTIIVEPLPPDTIYVSMTGSDAAGDGSPDNPLRTIPFAISGANPGSLIMVGPGSYGDPGEVPIVFPSAKSLTIRSMDGPFVTELVGVPSASGSVVVMDLGNDMDTASLEGFTIRDNSVTEAGCTYCAGGITVVSPTVAHIRNCIIRGNTGHETAGGVLFAGSGGSIMGNWIAGNAAASTMGVGGITVLAGAEAVIVNNSIVGNSGSGVAGILIDDETSLTRFDNNIMAFNVPGFGAYANSSLRTTPTLNNLYFGNGGDPGNFTELVFWVFADPMVVDAAAGDWHLTCNSPARGTGELSSVPPELPNDIDGQPRLSSNPLPLHVDIGADQFYDADKHASFIQSVDTGCAPLTVEFLNTSSCIDESWSWDFGDGSTASSKNASHEYVEAGVYEVRLIAFGAYDADTTYDTVHVDGSIGLTFTSDMQRGCIPFEVTFTAFSDPPVGLYTWDFGDGDADTGQQVTHTYTTVATRTVSVSATNSCSTSTDTKVDYIQAITLPDVQMTSSFDTIVGAPCSPFGVTFHYTSNYPILGWNWDFGDNHTSTDSMPFHTYAVGDTFSVRLIATGECGDVQDVNLSYIKLTPRPAVSNAAAAPGFACVGSTNVEFSANIAGNFTGATWLFGDGTSGSGPVRSHIYTQIGRYLPKLVVTSICGSDTTSLSDSITVGSLPAATFSADPDSGYEPMTVQFGDQSTNLPNSWQWRFGDNGTSASQSPTHVYTAGAYNASLIAGNPCGVDTSAEHRIVVGSFQVEMDSTGTSEDTILYSVLVDSQVIRYDHTVYLNGRISPLPIQGSMAFIFAPAFGVPPFESVLKAVPSLELASGNYSLEIRAVDSTRFSGPGQPITRLASRPYTHVGFTAVAVTPSPLGLDSAIVAQGLISRTVTVRNTSTPSKPFTLIVQSAQITGPPFEIVQGQGATLNPGGSVVWTMGFRPTKKGDFTGILHVRSNDPGNPDLQITMTGRGIGEQIPPRVTVVSPTNNAEATIDQALSFTFSEPLISTALDTVLLIQSSRTNAPVSGTRSMTLTGITFTPAAWFWPDDTITVTLRAIMTDTSGNRLDGNGDGTEDGPPTDDFGLVFYTGPGVYPGDANHDGFVNEADILPLGRFWRLQGPPRAHPYTSFSVQPARGFPTRIAAHADCDGNGIIDSADICPIAEFFERDTVLPKAVVQEWLAEAQSWSSSTVDALLGALVDCPTQTQGTIILGDVLRAMQSQNPLPISYRLEQNYPNPFNPATVIAFALPQAGDVQLDVFDILGQRITTLASGWREAGNHRVVWDGRDENGRTMASGVYFYRLQSAGLRQTRKMLLLK